MVTAGGLVFIGGSRDKMFRAFDKETGKVVWELELPGYASSNPSSYWSNGKQYIAVSVAGTKEKPAGFVMAFALPD
jgi:quinoprotein glucose dehydrogenase